MIVKRTLNNCQDYILQILVMASKQLTVAPIVFMRKVNLLGYDAWNYFVLLNSSFIIGITILNIKHKGFFSDMQII